jgi:long-chain acyl-CoA synthetase
MSTRSALSDRLTRVYSIDATATAVWDREREWTWGHIATTRAAIDAQLARLGVDGPGVVGIILRTRFAPVAAQLATLAGGHTIYALSPMMGDERLAADIAAAAVDLVLAEDEDWRRPGIAAACERAGIRGLALWPDEQTTLSTVVEGGPRTITRDATVATYMLTSGTTGTPKRIPITYRALENMLHAVRHYSSATRDAQDGDRLHRRPVVVASPLVHSSGFGGVLRAVAEARPVALLERFEPQAWTRMVETHQPRVTALPPTALRMLLDAGIEPARLASLRAIVVGSAALSPELAEEFESTYDIVLLPNYGATEFPGGLAGWTLADRREFGATKRTSVGRPHPGVELRVVDPTTGTILGTEVTGLLQVRTPATRRGGHDSTDGWVTTTDLASLDKDGFLYIHGRADEAIIRGGFKVIPREIEELLERHPAVVTAAVYGRPDARLGAVPVAAVETRAPVTPAELTTWLRERLAAYQVPVELHVLPQLPRTPSMKVSKPALRALIDEQNSEQTR